MHFVSGNNPNGLLKTSHDFSILKIPVMAKGEWKQIFINIIE
jgi:hypothetical protein